MKAETPRPCMVCQKYSGEVLPPGGILFENALVGITHAQLLGEEKEHYLGHLFVETRRHVAELGELTAGGSPRSRFTS